MTPPVGKRATNSKVSSAAKPTEGTHEKTRRSDAFRGARRDAVSGLLRRKADAAIRIGPQRPLPGSQDLRLVRGPDVSNTARGLGRGRPVHRPEHPGVGRPGPDEEGLPEGLERKRRLLR